MHRRFILPLTAIFCGAGCIHRGVGGKAPEQAAERYVELVLEVAPEAFRMRITARGRVEFEDRAGVQALRASRDHFSLVEKALSDPNFKALVARGAECDTWATEHGSVTIRDSRGSASSDVFEFQGGCQDAGYAVVVDGIYCAFVGPLVQGLERRLSGPRRYCRERGFAYPE